MIYLIRSYGMNRKSFLKVGFTNNLEKRFSSYFYHNPGSVIISTREGDEILENLLHTYLSFLGLQYKKNGKLNEWFLDDPRVYQIFHTHQDTLERKIWKHRDKIFDLSSKPDYKLFEYLYLRNKDSFIGEEIKLDGKRIIKTSAKRIDTLFWKSYYRKNSDKISVDIPKDISSDYLDEYEKVAQDFLDNRFYKTGLFHEKMRMYCEFMDLHKGNKEIQDIIYFKIKDPRFRNYYNYYNTSGCSSKNYQEKYLYEGMIDTTKNEKLEKAIYNFFKIGNRYTKKEIKLELERIYRDLGITSIKPKATDLGKYFSLIRTKIQKPSEPKKYSEGYKLESL